MNRHKPASWLVYFNGIEIPAISAEVTSRINDIPQARVTLPPDATMRRIGAEDRVRMTLFFQDPVEQDMRLMFDGEIVNYEYNTTSQGRSLTYTAVDMISVLTQMFPIFIGGLNSIMRNIVDTQENATGTTINPFAVTYSLFTIGLSGGEVIKRPYEFISNMILLLTGEGVAESNRSVISSHWFTRWLERTKFAERIFPSYDSSEMAYNNAGGFPILEATQKMSVLHTLAKDGDQIATNNSYYVMIQSMFQRVYYELSPVLAPPCVDMHGNTHDINGPAGTTSLIGVEGDPPPEPIPGYTAQNDYSETVNPGPVFNKVGLVQHVAQPKNFFGIPPKCNVFWPVMVESHSFSENFATQPTRTYLGNPELLRVMSRGRIGDLEDFSTTVGYPSQANDSLVNITEGEGSTNPNNFLVYPEEFFRGPVYNQEGVSTWFSMINEDEQLPSSDDSSTHGMDRLQKVYAALEHHRKKLSKRNGSVQMVFNPYPLLGHPCTVVDQEQANHHTFGYIVSISHSFGQNKNSTNVSYTYGQSYEEFFETYIKHSFEYEEIAVFEDRESFSSESYMSAPFYPIKYMRDKFQRLSSAGEYFGRLYWRKEREDVMFDWMDTIGVRPPEYDGTDEDQVDYMRLSPNNSNAFSLENEGYIPVYAVHPAYRDCTEDPDAAFQYGYRPVCTLDEYIEFQGEYGVGEGLRSPKNPREGKTAPYYVKILDFEQGPGEEPGETAQGDRCGPLSVDTRRNWEVRLLKFRQKVYQDDHHFRS